MSTAHADAAAEEELGLGGRQLYLPLELRRGTAWPSSAEGFCSSGKGAFHTEGERKARVSHWGWGGGSGAPKAPDVANPRPWGATVIQNDEQSLPTAW